MTSGERIFPYNWYLQSLVHAIDGDNRMALITLQRAIDEGWTQPLRIKEEPILQTMKQDTNFKAMVAGLETKISLMRERLTFEERFASRLKI